MAKPMRERLTLRDFLGDLMVVKLPRWVWWALAALAVLPIGLSIRVL